tara:strand:- start:259 stop:885 length:627 start_codon:yes stop_codon:yes gene_type:complete
MKLQLSLLLLVFSIPLVAQVGINNTDPQETLHVNGTVRIETTDQATVTTDKLFGLDAAGTLREVAVGTNLTLSGNTLSAAAPSGFDHAFGTITLNVVGGIKLFSNVDLLLDAGEANFGKTIIRVRGTELPSGLPNDVEIDGISGGYNGQHIWLYATRAKVTLIKDASSLSLAANRITDNTKLGALLYGMIELVYDGTRARWVVMQHHN